MLLTVVERAESVSSVAILRCLVVVIVVDVGFAWPVLDARDFVVFLPQQLALLQLQQPVVDLRLPFDGVPVPHQALDELVGSLAVWHLLNPGVEVERVLKVLFFIVFLEVFRDRKISPFAGFFRPSFG